MSKGDSLRAIEVLDKGLSSTPDDFEAFMMRASLRQRSGDIPGATADITSAIGLRPRQASLYERRALLRLFLRAHQGALADYDSALSFGAKSEKIICGRALVKRDLGDLDGAYEDYKNASLIYPDSPRAVVGVASIQEARGQKSEAASTLRSFLDNYEGMRDGKLPKPRSYETGDNSTVVRDGKEPNGSQMAIGSTGAMMIFKSDSPEGMNSELEKAEKVANLAQAYHSLARLQRDSGETEAALININKSLGLQYAAHVVGVRGSIRLAASDYKGAIRDVTEAYTANPMMSVANLADRGIAYLYLRQDADAQKDFDFYLQRFPANKGKLEARIAEANAKRK